MTKVSVILPTYNRKNELKASIDSVLNQTYTDYELIIVDNGSTDDTYNHISKYLSDDRIRYYYKQNGGVSSARNYGISKANGEYIAFQDSDDIWHKDKLEKQVLKLDELKDYGLVYGRIGYKYNNDYMVVPSDEMLFEQNDGDIYADLLYKNVIGCPCLMVRKECVESVGGFDEKFPALEDYDYALRLSKKYKAAFIDDVLVEASIMNTGVSSNALNHILASCKILGKYKDDLLRLNIFNHKIEVILYDAKMLGIEDKIEKFMEMAVLNPDI